MSVIVSFILVLIASTTSAFPVDTKTKDAANAISPRDPIASWQPSSAPSSPHSWAPSSIHPWNPSSTASGSLSTVVSWVPSTTNPSSPSTTVQFTAPFRPNKADIYTMFSGDGTTAEGWPDQSSWVDFNTMWSINQAIIASSCTQFGQANNSPDETANMLSAIKSVSAATSVDPRFILATVLQESKGCVRAPTTYGSVLNPGLMQDYDGTGTCNNMGRVLDPCPANEILQMITDGTAGTEGPGLVQDLEEADASDVSRYYKAARIYNSGSIPFDENLVSPGATPCYASDIANRLIGWVSDETECTL